MQLNKFFKNLIFFLAIFIAVNYLLNSCNPKEVIDLSKENNVIFTTTKNDYAKSSTVVLEIENRTPNELSFNNECPEEPFSVYKKENNDWVKKTVAPTINCENANPLTVSPGATLKVPYDNWNFALFSELGRFKIETQLEIDGEPKTITSNEFLVSKNGILRQLWEGVFYKPIYNGLILITAIPPFFSLGLAIILLTILIRTILLIPNHKAMVSQKKLQDIQPKLEKIKEKYKGDQQKISMETLALWKEAKVNPLGSCLPILMQLPFLIALFYVIQGGINPDNIHLLYFQFEHFGIKDINVHFLGLLDLTKPNIYVLPFIVGGLQFLQMKLALPKNKKKETKNEMAMATNMMVYIMPVMIAVFTASLPSGVGLYWGISTLYGIFQQLYINKSKTEQEATVKVIEATTVKASEKN